MPLRWLVQPRPPPMPSRFVCLLDARSWLGSMMVYKSVSRRRQLSYMI
jgi:hypothetical protein